MYSIDGSDDLVASVASAVGRLVEAVADGRVRELSHGELSELVVEVRREQARLESVLLTAVGEVDARGSHVHEGALTTSAWLRMHARATPAEATATVRTGRALRSGCCRAPPWPWRGGTSTHGTRRSSRLASSTPQILRFR